MTEQPTRQAMLINAETCETSMIEIPSVDALEPLQKLVGGLIEGVSLGDIYAYVNEEGKILGLPVNVIATRLWQDAYGRTDIIMGNMVVVGAYDDEGNEMDIPQEHVALVENAARKVQDGLLA